MDVQKVKGAVAKIWKDPVGSKVISVAILGLIGIIWAKLTSHSWADIYAAVISFLSYRLPIYLFLSAVAFYFIIKLIARLFKGRKNPFWDHKIGNYTFKELYNILITETLPIKTKHMEMSRMSAPEENLLELFRVYYLFLNKGVDFDDNIDDGSYLYSVLAPRFVGFGLVDAFDKPLQNLPDQKEVAYKTSALGHTFHACLEKLILRDKLKAMKEKKENKGKNKPVDQQEK